MRKIVLFFFTLLFLTGCSGTHLKFIKTEHNFGTVQQQKSYSYSFSFKNIAKKSIVIEKVKSG